MRKDRTDAIELSREFLRAVSLLRRKLAEGLRGSKVSPEEWLVLEVLWEQDGRTQSEISEETWRELPAITRLVDALVKRRLVKRKDDGTDRRRTRAWLTEEGRELERTLRPKVRARLEDVFSEHAQEETE